MSSSSAPLLVMKFGGTSLGDAERISAAAGIIASHRRDAELVVVASAMAGVTNALAQAAQLASTRDPSGWEETYQKLRFQHLAVAAATLSHAEREVLEPWLLGRLEAAASVCSGFALVGETTPRAMDALLSLGEVLSSALVAAALRSRGIAAEAVDAVELVVTDDRHGDATPLWEETKTNSRRRLAPLRAAGSTPVVTGFRGATTQGIPTTLGRGGSDYTATILGTCLDATEVWIWTDVDGVMTADPRLVPEATLLPELSYRETIELSFFGAKVLHAKAVLPALKAEIPILIKNSFNPSAPGTRIATSGSGRPGVRALTSVVEASLFTVTGSDSLSFTGLAARIFRLLDLDGVPSLMVTQSSAENVVCFAVRGQDSSKVRSRLVKEFEFEIRHDYLAEINLMPSIGVVVAIGESMKGTPGVAGRMFGVLGGRGINIIAIAQGSSELSISCAVSADNVREAVVAIHQEFGL